MPGSRHVNLSLGFEIGFGIWGLGCLVLSLSLSLSFCRASIEFNADTENQEQHIPKKSGDALHHCQCAALRLQIS